MSHRDPYVRAAFSAFQEQTATTSSDECLRDGIEEVYQDLQSRSAEFSNILRWSQSDLRDAINACSDAWTPKPHSPRSVERADRYEKEEFDVDQELTQLVTKAAEVLKRGNPSAEDALANDEDMKEVVFEVVKMQWQMKMKTEEVKKEDRDGTPPKKKDWCTAS